ncbi:MAG: hypothetical protein ACOY58_08180, partial [Candidatus Micrarchaeota archaeon]
WFEQQVGGAGIKLLGLDPLKPLVGGNYTKPDEAYRFMASVTRLSHNLGIPIILNHHLRKRDKRTVFEPGDLDEIKGAGDYCDHADTVLLLERERQRREPGGIFAPVRPGYYTLSFAKARYAEEELDHLTLKFNRTFLMFELAEEPRLE